MSFRSVIFDTETTGMNFESDNKAEGHRIIEIGCVELIDRVPTEHYFHCYLNPEQPVDPQAFKVHGISDEFLADKPFFKDVLPEFEAYLASADELVAHNIAFDRQFIDRELQLAGCDYRLGDKFTLVDSLKIAREKFAGARNNLDALCKRFGVDNTGRELHGALLDAQLLAEVYLKLTGGQSDLSFAHPMMASTRRAEQKTAATFAKTPCAWLPVDVPEAERALHEKILKQLKE